MAAGDDRHTLGIRMVSSALEEAGYNVMFLGNQLPFSSLRFILNQYPVKTVAMSASNPVYVNNISFMIKNLRENSAFDHISVIVGGQGFHGAPDLWKEVGADAYGDNTSIAVKMVSALIGQ
ncbi:cobalamin-dependent protein [Geoalkalibacter halelectricus]|uniref:Cobalamin-dependent protein n=1 Tax=Geoalkalibacter halelectricus TaxID=2847045 RepID=A0ABY5ZKY4_9BACT|nr:cobalamin-dependent protein [Geoalkalibacter halelectricus]UWZ79783.1 cobalamin-dependent protein [Geoalkalibacter halelectricus]